MAEDRLEGLTGGFVPTTPCPLLIRPVRPLPNGRIPPLHEDQNQYPLLKDTLASFPGPSPPQGEAWYTLLAHAQNIFRKKLFVRMQKITCILTKNTELSLN